MKIDTKSPEALDHEVYLDGIKQTYCFAADDEEGWADVHVIDGVTGRPMPDETGDRLKTARRYGRVEIRKVRK